MPLTHHGIKLEQYNQSYLFLCTSFVPSFKQFEVIRQCKLNWISSVLYLQDGLLNVFMLPVKTLYEIWWKTSYLNKISSELLETYPGITWVVFFCFRLWQRPRGQPCLQPEQRPSRKQTQTSFCSCTHVNQPRYSLFFSESCGTTLSRWNAKYESLKEKEKRWDDQHDKLQQQSTSVFTEKEMVQI